MIDFKNKELIPDCMERIRNAGIILYLEDNQIKCDDPVRAQLIIDDYKIEDARAWKKNLVAEKAKELRDKAISLYSPGEMAAWPIKLAEAANFNKSLDENDAPMLKAEAIFRQVTLIELVNKVNNKASSFAMLEAKISGIDGYHRDNIDKLNTLIDIAQYNYSEGWPEV